MVEKINQAEEMPVKTLAEKITAMEPPHNCPPISYEELEQFGREAAAKVTIHPSVAAQKEIEAALKIAGIPKRFLDRDFESYEATTDKQLSAKGFSKKYADH